MSDSLTELILSLTPEDGSSIGNGAKMALMRERLLGLSHLISASLLQLTDPRPNRDPDEFEAVSKQPGLRFTRRFGRHY